MDRWENEGGEMRETSLQSDAFTLHIILYAKVCVSMCVYVCVCVSFIPRQLVGSGISQKHQVTMNDPANLSTVPAKHSRRRSENER